MKLLKDLIISRREFQDWTNNLSWSRDGSLFLTTCPDLTLIEPIYKKDIDNNTKNMFYVKEYALQYANKFEFENAKENLLLNAQPVSQPRQCKPSPSAIGDGLIAVLTNNGNVEVFRAQNLVANLDEPLKELSHRIYHSMEWDPTGKYLFVGNEESEIIIYEVLEDDNQKVSVVHKNTVKVTSIKNWVTHIYCQGSYVVVGLGDNSVYLLSSPDESINFKEVVSPSRFKLNDVKLFENILLITKTGHLQKIDIQLNSQTILDMNPCEQFSIIPLVNQPDTVILLSNTTNYQLKIDTELKLMNEDTITPYLESKLKRWNSVQNDSTKIEHSLRIYGHSLSPDDNSLAILYNIENVSLKYKIISENYYHITFIPISETWKISKNATGLAWYQTYNIYEKSLPVSHNSAEDNFGLQTPSVNLPFREYIMNILSDENMNSLQFLNFVQDEPSIRIFREAIFKYACAKKSDISNAIDKACIQSLASVLSLSSPLEAEPIAVKGEFIEEKFNFTDSSDEFIISSMEGHSWKRCAVTLLPLLTTNVKICPVSNLRVIDLRKDQLNDYGWFTETLLEILNIHSVYSGTNMLTT